MSGNSDKRLAILLVIGVIVGAGVGYFLAPGGVDIGSSPYKTGYNEGYDDGYDQGQQKVDIATEDQDFAEEVTGLTTLVYGAIGASLLAALAGIVTLMQVSRVMDKY